MHAAHLEVVGEIEPGIPLLRYGKLFIVAKAGGFGMEQTLIRIIAQLKRSLEKATRVRVLRAVRKATIDINGRSCWCRSGGSIKDST